MMTTKNYIVTLRGRNEKMIRSFAKTISKMLVGIGTVKESVPQLKAKRPKKYIPLKKVNAYIEKLENGDCFHLRTVEIGYDCIFERKEKIKGGYRIFYRNKRRWEQGVGNKINKVMSHRIVLIRNIF